MAAAEKAIIPCPCPTTWAKTKCRLPKTGFSQSVSYYLSKNKWRLQKTGYSQSLSNTTRAKTKMAAAKNGLFPVPVLLLQPKRNGSVQKPVIPCPYPTTWAKTEWQLPKTGYFLSLSYTTWAKTKWRLPKKPVIPCPCIFYLSKNKNGSCQNTVIHCPYPTTGAKKFQLPKTGYSLNLFYYLGKNKIAAAKSRLFPVPIQLPEQKQNGGCQKTRLFPVPVLLPEQKQNGGCQRTGYSLLPVYSTWAKTKCQRPKTGNSLPCSLSKNKMAAAINHVLPTWTKTKWRQPKTDFSQSLSYYLSRQMAAAKNWLIPVPAYFLSKKKWRLPITGYSLYYYLNKNKMSAANNRLFPVLLPELSSRGMFFLFFPLARSEGFSTWHSPSSLSYW